MYKEIFIALCLVAFCVAFPAEDVQSESIIQPVQVEANGSGIEEAADDLATDESRRYGHRHHHHHHHRHHGYGHGGYYGGYRGGYYGGHRHGGFGFYG